MVNICCPFFDNCSGIIEAISIKGCDYTVVIVRYSGDVVSYVADNIEGNGHV